MNLIFLVLIPTICSFTSSFAEANLNTETATAFRSRDFSGAERLAQKAWERFEQDASNTDAGIAAANLGAIEAIRGSLKDARKWHATAEQLFRASGEERYVGRLKLSAALVDYIESRQYGNSEPDDALRNIEEARSLLGTVPHILDQIESELLTRSNQAERVQSGFERYLQILSVYESNGDSLSIGRCSARMGRVEGATGGHGSAKRAFVRAFSILDALGREVEADFALRNAGVAKWKLGDFGGARQMLEQVVARSPESRSAMLALNDISMLLAAQGETQEAIRFDLAANRVLRAILKRYPDHGSVTHDLSHLYKMRYVGRPTYTVDMFGGFFDYLAISEEDLR